MNVLFTLSQLEVTGAEVFAVTLADKLVEYGHSVYIISDTLTVPTKAVYQSLPLTKRNAKYRLMNTLSLKRFIKENKIDIVVANSRASAWVSSTACRLAKIPLIVVIHGRQSEFLSRRIFHGFGSYTLAVCEKLKEQLTGFFKVPGYKIEILRNGFDLSKEKPAAIERNEKIIMLIGRLSGPKGELAYKLLDHYQRHFKERNGVKFMVVGGQVIPPEFEKFKNDFEFTGFKKNIGEMIDQSSLIIGSGRIAMDALLRGRPVVAIGEACSIGLITRDNLDLGMATNFGDMNDRERDFDFDLIMKDIEKGLLLNECDKDVAAKMQSEFSLEKTSQRLESIFQSVINRYYKMEIPIIYYHKVINDESDAGRHGIYVTQKLFDEHMKFLSVRGYKTVTFEEALQIKKENRKEKYVIITFDDGYEDNYLYAFPVLKKYNFNAEIFLVAGLDSNEWDRKDNEPVSSMLKKEQIIEMHNYGIRFGSHTMNHKDLTKCTDAELEIEISGSKKHLEEKLGFEINSIAYPYGNYNNGVIDKVKKAGYAIGYATDRGPLGMHEDIFRIKRITIFPNTDKFHFARKVKGNYVFKKVKEEKDLYNIQIQDERYS